MVRKSAAQLTGAALGFALCVLSCTADELVLKLTSQDVLQKRMRAGLVQIKERQDAVKALFAEAGCEAVEQKVRKNIDNVICTLRGRTASTIIVGGHYDYRTEGQGMVDDWTGTALLASLYETLKSEPRQHTYKFVAFAAEELGLVGSEHFVKSMTADDKNATVAFVNLECLGLSPTKVWVSRSTPELVRRLDEIAAAVHAPIAGVNVDRVGDDDTHSFKNKNIPVISIHSVTPETLGILHSRRDNLAAVRMDDYYLSYRLIAFYLAYLDEKLTP